jgi:hypothetical protein
MTALPAKALLPLGQVVYTPGALAACGGIAYLLGCLARHQSGDWGCVCPEDGETNNNALIHGGRILSSYPIDPNKPCKGWGENTLWVITEADRSVTTFLLPEEY